MTRHRVQLVQLDRRANQDRQVLRVQQALMARPDQLVRQDRKDLKALLVLKDLKALLVLKV